MSEESILILNMLREGKLTADQADSLLRATREATPPPPPPVTTSPTPAPDHETLAAMQRKLDALQSKLGDAQGKVGEVQGRISMAQAAKAAGQAAKAAGQATTFAGKVLGNIPKPDIDFSKINKTVDEAVRGLNSFKNEAVRTAKVTARQAAQEARRATRSGRQAVKFDLHLGRPASDRPLNREGQPQVTETGHITVTWTGAETLVLANKYGSIKVMGRDGADHASEAILTKTAWAGEEAEARVLLQQVFLTSRVENGRCRIEIVAPENAGERLTVDYEIQIPRTIPIELMTTYGDIDAEEVSAAMTAETESGKIDVRHPYSEHAGDARFTSRGGDIHLAGWNAPKANLAVESESGDIKIDGLSTGRNAMLSSRSGDVIVQDVQVGTSATFDSISGDVVVTGGSVGHAAALKTQSGSAEVTHLRTDQLRVETVSGDALLKDVTGTLTAKTVSGEIRGEGLANPAISLSTVSGDARIKFAAPFSGSFAGTTVSGDLTLALWTNSEARIELNTTTGDLECSLPIEEKNAPSATHLSGKIGGGVGSIKLQSVSGDLRVEAQS